MKNLKEIRKSRGLTQKQLANLVGVSETNISRYESGDRDPPLDTLVRIAAVLNATTDSLLGIEKAPAPERNESEDAAMNMVRNLTAEEREKFFSLLQSLLTSTKE